MSIEQVFDWLREEVEKRSTTRYDWNDYVDVDDIIDLINEAEAKWEAERNIPELVARMVDSETKEVVYRDYRCGSCGMGVAEEYICCPYCGQKLDWSVVEK